MKRLFDIPRLKIGATTTKREEVGLESPPPTPKSVVPALSPKIDYELRTACALVLQDFKPSDYVYHERFGDADDDDPHLDRKTQLDYAAFMQALEDGSDEVAAPLDPVNTRIAPDRSAPHIAALQKPTSSLPKTASEKTTSQRYSDGLWRRVRGEDEDSTRYSDGLWKRVKGEQAAEDEEIRQRNLAPSRPKPAQPRTFSHQRSASQPIKLTGSPLKADFAARPKMERANSTQTPASTPGSEGTDHALPGSTAPTTAAITPAAHSKRASAHQRTKSADTKIGVVDGEWMRRELERHRQAQEEDNAQQQLVDHSKDTQDSEAFSPVTSNIDDAMSPVVQHAQIMQVTKAAFPVARVPARKPVPRATSDASQNKITAQGTESKPSVDLRRSMSQKRRSTPRSESRAELEILESTRQSREQSRPPPADPDTPIITYHSAYYTGVRAPAPSANVSKAPSRSRSITRQIREFVRRPSIGSRQPSAEISRPASRSRSMDSIRSAVSAMSSTDASSSKWKSWKPFHRAQSSTTSVDDSGADTRGRDAARDTNGKIKPPINLNRELPPLPSLDQWKNDDTEPEPPVPSMPRHIPNTSIDTFATAQTTPPLAHQARSQNPSIDSTTSHRARDSVLNDASPPPASHPKRMSSLGAPTNPLKYQNPATTNVDPSTLPSTPDTVPELPSNNRRLSRSATEELSPQRSNSRLANKPLPTRTTSLTKQNPTSNIANATPRHITPLHRTASTALPNRPPPAAPVNPKSMSMDQSRPQMTAEQQQLNFSRKISSDYQRQNAEANYQYAPAPPMSPVKDEKKKKWWKAWRGKGKEGRGVAVY